MPKENNNDIKETLAPILRVLTQLGGKFSFTDDEGRQFVIMQQADIKKEAVKEKQLSLPKAPDKTSSADDVLERINKEIAYWQMQDQEEMNEANQDNESSSEEHSFHDSQAGVPTPPSVSKAGEEEEPRRVRFEPLKGDLDPELQ